MFGIFTLVLIFELLANSGVLTEGVECGRPQIHPHTQRIVGGHEALEGSWPWMAMLAADGRQTCGGVILGQYTILTAAHCFDDEKDKDPMNWLVYVGKHHVHRRDSTESSHHVNAIYIHQGYDYNTVRNDIALLKLEEPIFYGEAVSPACLPPYWYRVVDTGSMCYTTGWGDTRGTGDRTVLNQVGLPLIHDYFCSRSDWYGVNFTRYYTFCAGYKGGGKDACTGDSGGPYNCLKDGRWYVQGIASWGYDCAQPQWPGIYTDVSKYVDWIRNTAQQHDLSIDGQS